MNNLILLCKARQAYMLRFTFTIKPLSTGFQTIACMPDVTGEVCGRTIERIVSVLSTGTVLLTRVFVWLIMHTQVLVQFWLVLSKCSVVFETL